jgi:hypothetical protein
MITIGYSIGAEIAFLYPYQSYSGVDYTMPMTPKDDLAGFQMWLQTSRFIARRTASVYASRVRNTIRLTEQPLCTEHLDTFLHSGWADSSRDGYYCAWNRFAEYCATKDIDLPRPTLKSDQRAARREYFIPPRILDCILELISVTGMKAKVLPKIQVKHINRVPNNGMWEMADPTENGLYYRVPISLTMNILEWGHTDEPTPDSPLIPIVTNSLEPMPLPPLKRLLSRRKNSR